MADERPDSYDVVVVGAGSTGENVADYAHRGGLSVALVEAELVGGDCSYWACMPSKALLRPAEVLRAALRVDGAREAVSGDLDSDAVLARRTRFTSGWDDSSQADWVRRTGLDLVRGSGRLAGEKTVVVTGAAGDERTLTARHAVVLCHGSEASLPPIEGLAAARPWTSREATSATQVPRRLAVLGGGVVGCELATAWRALGAEEVTLIAQGPLLGRMEPEAGRRLASAMGELGVTVRTGTAVTRVERAGPDGPVTVTTAGGATVVADEVLAALGRQPRDHGLGLETVGLQPGRYLDVDDTLAVRGVAGGWLYCAGDANGRALLTHMGKYQARACGTAIAQRAAGRLAGAPWSRTSATADAPAVAAVPQVVFTDPQVASVGLTEAQARERGLDVVTSEYEIGSVAGAAVLADGYQGWAKLVVDRGRGVLVGATFLGQEVAELVHSATVAVVGEVPLSRLWHAVPSYPTVSEVWLRLLDQLEVF